MIIDDDRTEMQKNTHRYLVIMTDRFLSGWGMVEGGKSYAAWACEGLHEAQKVETIIRKRSDAMRVRMAYDGPQHPYRPSGKGHTHIYVVDENSTYA